MVVSESYPTERDNLTSPGEKPILPTESKWRRPLAVCLSLISAIGTCVNGFIIKEQKLDATDFLALRCLLQLIVIPAVLCATKQEFWPSKASRCIKLGIILQGLLLGLVLLTFFATVRLLPLGEAMAIVMSCPVFTAVFARCFLGQRLRLWKLTFMATLMTGLLCVIQPKGIFSGGSKHNVTDESTFQPVARDESYYLGAFLGVVCAAISGLYSIVLSGQVKGVPPFVLMFYASITGLAVAGFSTAVNAEQNLFSHRILELTSTYWLFLIGVAVLSAVQNLCAIKAYQLTDPTTVVVLHQLQLVLAFIIQVYILGQVSNAWAVSGAVLVFLSVVMITLEKFFVNKVKSEAVQKWL